MFSKRFQPIYHLQFLDHIGRFFLSVLPTFLFLPLDTFMFLCRACIPIYLTAWAVLFAFSPPLFSNEPGQGILFILFLCWHNYLILCGYLSCHIICRPLCVAFSFLFFFTPGYSLRGLIPLSLLWTFVIRLYCLLSFLCSAHPYPRATACDESHDAFEVESDFFITNFPSGTSQLYSHVLMITTNRVHLG